MSKVLNNILKEYWGYDGLRVQQNEIIQSILDGKDTLGILPTGGGKSICYQLPSLVFEGVTIVISPLIALMQEQVQELNYRKIKAYSIHGGLKQNQIDVILDNCIYGDVKLLYLAPERLKSHLVIERLKRMKISLVAIDEAHCVSQWGNDFRPEYQEIYKIREITDAPFLALTGSATSETQKEIVEKLHLEKSKLIKGSIYKENLKYIVRKEYNKKGFLAKFLSVNANSGIIYIRNRKKCEQISAWLNKEGFSATYYHAGLSSKDRQETQRAWVENEHKVMVCTNAFGMGINKTDLEWVIHFDLPSNIEDYYQETGRAGRAGQDALAIALWNDEDIKLLDKNYQDQFPDIKLVKQTYQSIVNQFQLAKGAGEGESFPIDLYTIAKKIKSTPKIIFNTVKLIERAGYWYLNDNVQKNSKLMFLMSHKQILRYIDFHPVYGKIIQTMLRSYSGLHTDFQNFQEKEVAERCGMEERDLIIALQKMHEQDVLDYQRVNFLPKVNFLQARVDTKTLSLPNSVYLDRKKALAKQLKAFKAYIQNENDCRFVVIGSYFGERLESRCRKCDNCEKSSRLNKKVLKARCPIPFDEVKEIELKFPGTRKYIKVLIDEGELSLDHENKVILSVSKTA